MVTILTMIDRSKKTRLLWRLVFLLDKFNLKRRIIGIMDSRSTEKVFCLFL